MLARDLQPELLNLTFTDHLGNTTPTLKEYLVGPRQVQAMMMAHKGKVVFETYPGMNPLDYPCVDVRIQDDRRLARLHAGG